MQPESLELEGTWEEILTHSRELAGRRVRLTVLSGGFDAAATEDARESNQQALDVLRELDRNPLPPEEIAILDEFPQFQKEHPFRIRSIEDEP